MRVLHESDNRDMPWTVFEIQFAKECCFEEHQYFADSQIGQKSKEKKAQQLREAAASRKRAGVLDDEDKKLEEDLKALAFSNFSMLPH